MAKVVIDKKIFFTLARWLIFWLFGIVVAMSIGYLLLPSRYQPLSFLPAIYQQNFLLWSWANFDGEHYLNIAQFGYQTIRGQSEYAFFPFFPLLIKVLGTLFWGDYYFASHIIVALSLVFFLYLLLKYNPLKTPKPHQLIVLILLFPGAIFLASIYTESLFLFFTALAFILVERKSLLAAALVIALATATRINGLSLVIFFALSLRSMRAHLAKKIGYLFLSCGGIIGYMVYLYQKTNNPFAFFAAQSGWGKNNLTMPWDTAWRYISALTFELKFDLVHFVVFVEVLVTAYLLTLLFFVIKNRTLSPPYLAYCFVNLALPLGTGSLGSMPRFGLLLFPLFVVLSTLKPQYRAILYIVSGLLAAIGTILFTRGYWWA